jgi:hypothetical protein
MKVGIYDREAVPATQTLRLDVCKGRDPKRRNEEEDGHMIAESKPRESSS